jgi:hypothetical protein
MAGFTEIGVKLIRSERTSETHAPMGQGSTTALIRAPGPRGRKGWRDWRLHSRQANFTLLIHFASGQLGRWPQLLTYS